MKIECLSDKFSEGENKSRVLKLTLEDEYAGMEVRLSFVTPRGNAFVSEVIEPLGSEYTYSVPFALLDGVGILQAQIIVFGDADFCAKSSVYSFNVSQSLPDGDVPDDMPLLTLSTLDTRLTEIENNLNVLTNAEIFTLLQA